MISIIKEVGSRVLGATGSLPYLWGHTRILAFHRVKPLYFVKQMSYLKQKYRVVSLRNAIKDLDKKQVVLTFDDGYRNNYLYAYPVLKKLSLPATLFITYNFIDKDIFAWWDRAEVGKLKIHPSKLKSLPQKDLEFFIENLTGLSRTSAKPEEYRFMSWKEVAEIRDVFEIGSHTIHHTILSDSTLEQATKEIALSKKRIEKKIKQKVDAFAYPNGDWNHKIAGMAKDAGYKCALTYSKGVNKQGKDLFSLYRRGINIKDDEFVFAAKVAGVF